MGKKSLLSQGCILAALLFMLPGCFSFPTLDFIGFGEDSVELDVTALRIGVTPVTPPLIYKEGGRIVGFEADLALAFAASLRVPVHFVELDEDDQVTALQKGKVDLILSRMALTQDQSSLASFCNPYFRGGQMMLVDISSALQYPRGFYDLRLVKDIQIGVVKESRGDDFVSRNLPKAKERRYKNTDLAVQALIRGQIDAVIHDAPVIVHAAARNAEKGVVPVYHLLTEEYLTWAVKKDNTALQGQANDFLKAYKEDGRLDSSLRQWLPYLN